MSGWHRRNTFWTLIAKLLGHLVGSAAIFVTLFTLGWALSWYLSSLEGLHAFEPESAAKLEKWWFWGDAFLSVSVFVSGIFRFIRDVLEG